MNNRKGYPFTGGGKQAYSERERRGTSKSPGRVFFLKWPEDKADAEPI